MECVATTMRLTVFRSLNLLTRHLVMLANGIFDIF